MVGLLAAFVATVIFWPVTLPFAAVAFPALVLGAVGFYAWAWITPRED